jgi:hypothetical protein
MGNSTVGMNGVPVESVIILIIIIIIIIIVVVAVGGIVREHGIQS